MRTLLLGSFVALASLTVSAQSGKQEKVTIQFESDRPEVVVTSATGAKQTVDLRTLKGYIDDDRLASALNVVSGYESMGWAVVGKESCRGVASTHYTWVVGKPKQ